MRLFSSRLKIGIIIILLVVFFIVLNFTTISKEVKNFFYSISSPIQKTFWQAGDRVSDFFEAIQNIKKLQKENEELKLRVEGLIAENTILKELKKENEILRDALEIGLEKDFQLVFTKIIGKDISQDTILINKGSKDGILKDFPVITQEKILVGRVGEVYDNFSKVILISNKESSFDAKIPDTEIQGIVKGKGNLESFLDLILKEKEIKEGDLVITTSLGGIFPEGLLVGKVKTVKKSDVEPFQKAEISLFFDIKEIENLFIITKF